MKRSRNQKMKTITYLFAFLITTSLFAQVSTSTDYSIGKKLTIHSDILEEDREVFIYVPEGFWGLDDSLTCYPVTFVLDGESQFLNTVSVIDYMSSAPMGNDLMPRTIVVGIPNTNRNRDLTPRKGQLGSDVSSLKLTGGGPKFLNFILEELLPQLDSMYSLCEHRTIIGHSLGGLLVFEALLTKRDYFDNYLAIDPGLGFGEEAFLEEVLDTLRTADLTEENLFVASAGTGLSFLGIENLEKDTSEIAKLPQSNLRFSNAVKQETWKINLKHQYFEEENHFSIPYPATYQAIKHFYSYYPFKEMMSYYHPKYAPKTDLVEKLNAHYERTSNHLGFKAIPLESYINSWAFGLDHFGRKDLALDMFKYSLELYPQNSSAYNTIGFYLLNSGRNKEAVTFFEQSLELEEDLGIRDALNQARLKK